MTARRRPKDFSRRVNAALDRMAASLRGSARGHEVSAQPFVFSIRPAFVERILGGRKAWEFRTRRPSLELPEMILIYETAPTSMIVASAVVTRIMDARPKQVWDGTAKRGVSAVEFADYFEGRSRAVALLLTDVIELPEFRPLPPTMRPPQAWSRYKGAWS